MDAKTSSMGPGTSDILLSWSVIYDIRFLAMFLAVSLNSQILNTTHRLVKCCESLHAVVFVLCYDDFSCKIDDIGIITQDLINSYKGPICLLVYA